MTPMVYCSGGGLQGHFLRRCSSAAKPESKLSDSHRTAMAGSDSSENTASQTHKRHAATVTLQFTLALTEDDNAGKLGDPKTRPEPLPNGSF